MDRDKPTALFVAVPANMGGSNRSLATLITAMRAYATCVLASPGDGPFRKYCIERNVADAYISLPHGDRRHRILAAVRLAGWILRNRSRLKVIHAQALTGLNLVTLGSVLGRIPVLVRVSDPEGSAWGRRLGPILARLLPRLAIAPVSDAALAVAVDAGLCAPEEAIVIPNPVDPADVVFERPDHHRDLVVGFLGGPTPRKGFDLLPQIVDLVETPVRWKLFTHPRLEGEAAEAVAALRATGVVEFLGREADVRKVYAQVDIVLVPSRAESFSRVVAEAMMNGIPVIASDIEPHRTLLGEDEAGILVPVGDVHAAARAIDHLVNDNNLRVDLGHKGRERGKAYAPEGIARRLLPLYGIEEFPTKEPAL